MGHALVCDADIDVYIGWVGQSVCEWVERKKNRQKLKKKKGKRRDKKTEYVE
jgi:hypothetical protein